MTKDEARAQGLMTRSDLVASSGLSESSFDRLNLEPLVRSGRYSFYSGRQVLVALMAREYRRNCSWLSEAAARQQAEDSIDGRC